MPDSEAVAAIEGCGGVDERLGGAWASPRTAGTTAVVSYLPPEMWIKVLEQLAYVDPVDFFRARELSKSFDAMVKQSRPKFSFGAYFNERSRSGTYKRGIQGLLR